MIPLIRKDKVWLIAFLLIGILAPSIRLSNISFKCLWIYPLEKENLISESLYILLYLLGISFGVFAGIYDEIMRTEEFLRHRSVSLFKIFAVKTSSCLVVICLWIIAPFILSLLILTMFTSYASYAYSSRFLIYISAGVVAFSAFAVGYYSSSLRVTWPKRIVFGLLSLVAMTYLSYMITMGHEAFSDSSSLFTNVNAEHTIHAYLVLHLVFTFVLILGAYANYVSRMDKDRPWELKSFLFSGSLFVIFVIIVSSLILTLFQNSMITKLGLAYPYIGKINTGKLGLCIRNKNKFVYEIVNKEHETVAVRKIGIPQTDSIRELWRYRPANYYKLRGWALGRELREFTEPVILLTRKRSNNNSCSHFYFNSEDRLVHKFTTHFIAGNTYSLIKIGKAPDNRPFSNQLKWLSKFIAFKKSEFEQIIFHETTNNELWTYSLNNDDDSFRRVNFPNGESYVNLFYVKYENGEYVIQNDVNSSSKEKIECLIEGDNNYYFLRGKILVKADKEVAPYVKSNNTTNKYSFKINNHDPISPLVEVVDFKGDVIFTHQYDPYLPVEKYYKWLTYIASMIRAPIFQVMSFIKERQVEPSLNEIIILDPLLSGSKRIWLLLVNLILSIAMVCLVIVSMKKRNASKKRYAVWAGFILIGGFAVYLLYFLIETKRAYRNIPEIINSKKSKLLIRS